MKVLFLDIDGVLATPKQYGTARHKLYKKHPKAEDLQIPYMWDERCVVAMNRFLLTHKVEIVLSSDWRLHYTLEQMDRICRFNGLAKSPIGFTTVQGSTVHKLEAYRVAEIQAYVAEHQLESWCAVDDMDLSELGTRFVKTDERMGCAATGFIEKLEMAMFPESRYTQHGIYQ